MVVPKKIPLNPIRFPNIIDAPKFIIDSNIGTYLSSAKIPAFSLKIQTDFLNPDR